MENIEDIFKNSGGCFEGHTVFKNGFHGNGWFEKGFIIRNPILLDQLTRAQADLIKMSFPNTDLLVGPVYSGALLATHVAKHLNLELTITLGKGDEITFHHMYVPAPPRKVVVIEDMIFTGTDVKANVRFLKNKGFDVEGVCVLVNRQPETIEGVKVISVLEKPLFEYYESDKCPLCEKGVEIKYDGVRE